MGWFCSLSLMLNAQKDDEYKPYNPSSPTIQLALLLDTSNSMDGLIEQAKSQLWKMANTLARKKRNGANANLEIAIYEYGNDNLDAGEGYIRQIVGFTTDMDVISEKLFSLKTNGGSEYCGWVLKDAIDGLRWSEKKDDLKIINIAGNESFDQGKVNPIAMANAAIKKGITVNTIYCGEYKEGISLQWQTVAILTEGDYLNINTDAVVKHIPTPYDPRILELNIELNQTYIPIGSDGYLKKERMETQDSKANEYGLSNVAERITYKAKQKEVEWDLVDSYDREESSISVDDLPPAMQSMKKEERIQYLDSIRAKRTAIQKEILFLERERNNFIEKIPHQQENTLDNELLKSVENKAKKIGFY